jgi:hypothetical protein
LVDKIIPLALTACPDCGHPLAIADIAPKISLHIELVEKPIILQKETKGRFSLCRFVYFVPPLCPLC